MMAKYGDACRGAGMIFRTLPWSTMGGLVRKCRTGGRHENNIVFGSAGKLSDF